MKCIWSSGTSLSYWKPRSELQFGPEHVPPKEEKYHMRELLAASEKRRVVPTKTRVQHVSHLHEMGKEIELKQDFVERPPNPQPTKTKANKREDNSFFSSLRSRTKRT